MKYTRAKNGDLYSKFFFYAAQFFPSKFTEKSGSTKFVWNVSPIFFFPNEVLKIKVHMLHEGAAYKKKKIQ